MKPIYKKAAVNAFATFAFMFFVYLACNLPLKRGFPFGMWFAITMFGMMVAWCSTINENGDKGE
jgi:hypothetical protein